MIRVGAGLAGVLIVSAATVATVEASGGIAGGGWAIPVAVAVGLIAGAACVGRAWHSRRRMLAALIGVALVAGEAYALISTGERVIAQRDAGGASDRDAAAKRERATAALQQVRTAVPASTPRLDAAKSALTAANDAVIAKAAEKACAANCRALLEQQVQTATAERDAAMTAWQADHKAAVVKVEAAQADLAAIPIPSARTGLAERIGVAGWQLDLLSAALASIALNGLGAGLITFASHAGGTATTPAPRGSVVAFLADRIAPARGGALPIREVYRAYIAWCSAQSFEPVPPDAFGDDLRGLVERLRLTIRRDDAGLVLEDVALGIPQLALARAS